MKGGLKLLLSKNNDGFEPVYEMIMNDKSNIKLMTASSLSGFIFTLEVPEDVSRYADVNSDKTGFDKIITNFVIKIVLTSGRIRYMYKNKYKNKLIKTYETNDDFYKEAKSQQKIWMKSIENGASEICPSVANLSFLDKQNTQTLFSILANKSNNDKNMIDVLEFLNENNQNGMGILTMKNYKNSKTMGKYLYDKNVSQKDRQHVLNYTMVKVIRLALLGYVHYDLHENNVLVTDDINNKSVLIDFGRVIRLRDFFNDRLLPEKYTRIIQHIKDVNANKRDTKDLKNKLKIIAKTVLDIDMYMMDYKFNQDNAQSKWLFDNAFIDDELFLNEAFKKNSHPIVFHNNNFANNLASIQTTPLIRSLETGRCPKGTRRNKKTGNCEKAVRLVTLPPPLGQVGHITPSLPPPLGTFGPIPPVKKPKCPKGTRRNKKTGNCETRGVPVGHVTPSLPPPLGQEHITEKHDAVMKVESSGEEFRAFQEHRAKLKDKVGHIPPVKKPKCPKGTRRNKKTGNCEPRSVAPQEPNDARGVPILSQYSSNL